MSQNSFLIAYSSQKMDVEKKAKEAEVFQSHFAILQRLLTSSHEACLNFAAELFAKGLVPQGIINEVQVPGAKGVMAMLSSLMGKVQNEPEAFYKFLTALEADRYFMDIAAKMRKDSKGEAQQHTVETDGGRSNGIGIKDLDVVDEAIKDVVEWEDLGLKLGIYYPTLEKISVSEHHKVNKCRKKMLQEWLKGRDKVKILGGPTWLQMVGALRKLGDNALADHVQSKFGPFF